MGRASTIIQNNQEALASGKNTQITLEVIKELLVAKARIINGDLAQDADVQEIAKVLDQSKASENNQTPEGNVDKAGADDPMR